MGKKLSLLTGAAIAIEVAIDLVGIFVPSVESSSSLASLALSGIWAALGLLVLLTGAQRKHKLVTLIALASAVTLSFFTSWFGFPAFLLWYFGGILFVGTVLVFAALRLFRKRPSVRAFLLPITMIMMGCSGMLLSAWSARPAPPIPEQAMSTSDELKYIHDTDQSDRLDATWMINPARDQFRLQRVKALYSAGQITEPMDQLNAAIVYQHASCADDFKLAYDLASAAEASPGVPESFPPLSHLAYDRWQLSLGKQQTYGTQFFPVPIKRPCPPSQ